MTARKQWHGYSVAFVQSELDSLLYSHEYFDMRLNNIEYQSNFQIPVFSNPIMNFRKSFIPRLLTRLIQRSSTRIFALEFVP